MKILSTAATVGAILLALDGKNSAVEASTHSERLILGGSTFYFAPRSRIVSVGETVNFYWNPILGYYNIQRTDGMSSCTALPKDKGGWDSGVNIWPHTYSITFDQPGDHYYMVGKWCDSNAKGHIKVVAATTATASTGSVKKQAAART
ncbi:hypothetical protein GQ42DRAFT_31919 [Ramicandelaber brevisporus]|nr:hypothetical protein GQ42DRAFT_31919 [Ramicandelaber brevisporus]